MKNHKHLRWLALFVSIQVLTFVLIGCDESQELTILEKYTVQTDVDELYFPPEGGTLSLVISTNASWQLHTPSNDLSFTPGVSAVAAENETLQITLPPLPNGVYDDSETTLTIRVGDLLNDLVIRKFINIVQEGYEEPVFGDIGIRSVSDWEAFANAVNSEGDISPWEEDGVVNLRADIDFGQTPIKGVGSSVNNSGVTFEGHFNGNGFTMTGGLENPDDQLVAIFRRLGANGIIENLNVNVTVESAFSGSSGHLAGIVAQSVASITSYVDNCTVSGTITHTGVATRVGGIIGYARCDISNCTNNATIASIASRTGGVIGAGGSGDGGSANTITNCINNGDVTLDNKNDGQIGGIIGQVNRQNVKGCVNEGNITAVANETTIVGGIIGDARGSAVVVIGGVNESDKNINKGSILLISADGIIPDAAAAGGIVGNINVDNITLTNNENQGSVISQVDDASVSAGGISGKVSSKAVVSGCINTSSAIVSSATQAGGIVGSSDDVAVIDNNENQGTIESLTSATIPEAGSFIGGIIGNKGTAILTNNTNGGTVLGAPGTTANAEGQ